MKNLILLCLLQTWVICVYAQNRIEGRVSDKLKRPLKAASISDLSSVILCQTDSNGYFTFLKPDTSFKKFVVSCPGFQSDTISIGNRLNFTIELEGLTDLGGFKVKADGGKSLAISDNVSQTEIIGQGEIKKAACCDLAGCFETQGTVQPMTTNIITNAKELRILGLSGVYNQVLTDGIPMMQGLGYTYGISSIPGTLLDNIFVSKGTTSVLQGFESMVGQINVIPKNPDKGERLFLNSYINSFGENQHNLNFRFSKGKWSNLTALHLVQPAGKWDRDDDRFLDLPLLKRYLIYDKIKYGDERLKGVYFLLAFKFMKEERNGGQLDFNPQNDLGSNKVYGQQVGFMQSDIYLKTGIRLNDNDKLSIMGGGIWHDQKSWFGTVSYKGLQRQGYANLQYDLNWNSNHEFKTGLSYRSLEISEHIGFSDTSLKRTYAGYYPKREYIPGLFAENTFKWRGDIITLITGIRADYHNYFGWQITPRAMLKYDVSEKMILRASAGTGWRTVNMFSENIGLLVSSRNILFNGNLNPEKAFNWGVNGLRKFKFKKLEGFFTIDFYQTRFANQFFPDYDSEPGKAIISDFGGHSVSNGFQTDFNMKFMKIWEIKLAYNYLDVYRKINDVKMQLPFNSTHKVLMSLSYLPPAKKWRADLNAHWFGSQRLPDTDLYPEDYRQAGRSDDYTVFNLQITRNWKNLDIYAGCENLFDFRQLRPIVSWQDPFSPYFDTSFNWGPTRGREMYIGFRWKLK